MREADGSESKWNMHPWFAPRVLLHYFEMQMQDVEPVAWIICGYDGGLAWVEMQALPENGYRGDADPNKDSVVSSE